MFSPTQITAHRAQSTSRSKSRWQPYLALPQTAIVPRSPVYNSMHPPKPSLNPLPPSSTPHSKNSRSRSSLPCHISKDFQRDSTKHKFALGLIDQAVKSLTDIWHSEDIPSVFCGPKKEAISSLPIASQLSAPTLTRSQQMLVSTGVGTDSMLLPLKNFVHEVLKRSRTSGSILQTALCYLEAVRPNIPDILRDEKMGIRSHFMPETAIQPATEAEMQIDSDQERPLQTSEVTLNFDQPADVQKIAVNASNVTVEPAAFTPSVNHLPSPLLCPRRTFLAALILASKFSQDKCYSNRAWAKLSGLPPREIGRCERALGIALDWRLWVGKKSLTLGSADVVTPASGSVTTARSVVRSQSESCVVTPPSARVSFLCPSEPGPSRQYDHSSQQHKGLRRCATAPSESFAPSNHLHPSSGSSQSIGRTPLCQSTSSYDVSDSGSSISSPITPSLSLSGDCTIQVSSIEEGPFHNSSRSWLGITDSEYAPIRTASPTSFFVDAKAAGAKDMQTERSVDALSVVAGSDPLLGLCGISYGFGSSGGPRLWHADVGHVSLEPTRVH